MKLILAVALSLSIGVAAARDVDIVAGPLTGRVVNSSGEGVPDAVVTAQWTGSFNSWSESASRCVRATAVKADSHGYFVMPGWQKRYGELTNVFLVVAPYKSGFTIQTPARLKGKRSGSVIELASADVTVRAKQNNGTPEERRQAIELALGAADCSDPDTAGMAVLYREALQEAKTLPVEKPLPGNATLVELLEIRAGQASGRPAPWEATK